MASGVAIKKKWYLLLFDPQLKLIELHQIYTNIFNFGPEKKSFFIGWDTNLEIRIHRSYFIGLLCDFVTSTIYVILLAMYT